ncbi:hypothetical protein B0H10DRAFT_2048367 [Mycena sp. CBHHK59/15]|nr:hypothetical protein B0H10DRAFT_2048367 [Mycena sp. CBHHK59/15]
MDDSPPPAYTKEYKGPIVVCLDTVQPVSRDNHNVEQDDETESQDVDTCRTARGRGSFPRPLPPLPSQEDPFGGRASLKSETVSPLCLHKKSQSTVSPSATRPWKPPRPDEAPSKWDATVPNPPQFRHRETELPTSPLSHAKYFGTSMPPTVPMHPSHFRRPTHATTPTAVDASSFYK